MTPLPITEMTDLIAPLGEPQRSKVRDYIRSLEQRLALAESALKECPGKELPGIVNAWAEWPRGME